MRFKVIGKLFLFSLITAVLVFGLIESLFTYSHFEYYDEAKHILDTAKMIQPYLKDAWKVNFFSSIIFPDRLYRAYIPDRDTFWKVKPNRIFSDNGVEYKINSKGMRGEEISYAHPANLFRILFLGDSCTFGWGVPYECTYPYLLKKMLNEDYPNYNFEIINAAVPGYSTYQGLQYFKREAFEYKPDMIVAFFGAADCSFNLRSDKNQSIPSKSIVQIDHFLITHTKLYGFLKCLVLRLNLRKELVARVSYDDFFHNLATLKTEAEKSKTKIIFIFPVWREGNKLYENSLYHFEPGINFYTVFQERMRSNSLKAEDIIYDGVHPSSLGAVVIAQELYKNIIADAGLIEKFKAPHNRAE